MLCFVLHSASVDKHSASGLDQIVPSTAEQQRYLPLLPEKRVLTASDWLRAPQLSNVVAGEVYTGKHGSASVQHGALAQQR